MKIYKFGGASVKDADGVRNVAKVLNVSGFNETLIVVSAMGKTTNALEEVVDAYLAEDDFESKIGSIKAMHLEISQELFSSDAAIHAEIDVFFNDLEGFLRRNKSPNYDYVYDQVVSCGELISSKILSAFLNQEKLTNQWLDVREYLKTDDRYRGGRVDWQQTEKLIGDLDRNQNYVTQGFLGASPNFFTTTLGREGSDYTAAIFGYSLNAESVTIWKDVPGVLNGDPRYFENTILLNEISYEEAIELAYYGASVIHPKTIQPLKQKDIPFFVKSFVDPTKPGTAIKKAQLIEPEVPCYILKQNQYLWQISTKDFSFITEGKISGIFKALSKANIKVNLMQNSAITLSMCVEDKYRKLEEVTKIFEENYEQKITENVMLYTIRHFQNGAQDDLLKNKEVLLYQTIKDTQQFVVKV